MQKVDGFWGRCQGNFGLEFLIEMSFLAKFQMYRRDFTSSSFNWKFQTEDFKNWPFFPQITWKI